MLSTRVKAALIFTPLVLLLIYLGEWPFNLFVSAILVIGAVEYARLFRQIGASPFLPTLIFGIIILVFQRWFLTDDYLGAALSVAIFVTAITALVQYERGTANAALNFSIMLGGLLYLGWVGGSLITLRSMDDGRGWLLTALPAVWLADSGAYFVGKGLGKARMTPRLSPGKTWAGLIGAVITGAISGLLLVLLWRTVGWLPGQTPLWKGALLGLLLAVLTPVGDLLISLFKRTAGVKDTGNLIPGHGGMLDRIDTWIWAGLIGSYFVKLLG